MTGNALNRLWSIPFFLVPIVGIGLYVFAASRLGGLDWWLPESIGPRTEAIDYWFNLIHIIMGVVFAATGLILAIAIWRFERSRSETASLFHSNTKVEVLWTVIPAAVLIFISLAQLPTWNRNKIDHPEGGDDGLQRVFVRVESRQFGWRFIYPGDDGEFDTADDVFRENELFVPVNELLVLELVSKDVIHSFYVPGLRLKQDIVPGLAPRVWFEVSKAGSWDIVCAELCGWGHYKMRASLVALSQDDFEERLESLTLEQHYYEQP